MLPGIRLSNFVLSLGLVRSAKTAKQKWRPSAPPPFIPASTRPLHILAVCVAVAQAADAVVRLAGHVELAQRGGHHFGRRVAVERARAASDAASSPRSASSGIWRSFLPVAKAGFADNDLSKTNNLRSGKKLTHIRRTGRFGDAGLKS